MIRSRRRDLVTALFTVACGAASLRAGCTQWRIHLEGTVEVNPAYARYKGAPIRIGLEPPADGKDAKGHPTRIHRSHPLVAKYHGKKGAIYDPKKSKYEFQYCSGLTDVWYRANLFVWLDVNKNGRYDAGEPRAALKQNPLTRDKETEIVGGVTIVLKPKAAPRPRPRRAGPAARPRTAPIRIAPSLPTENERPRPRPAARPRPAERPRPRP